MKIRLLHFNNYYNRIFKELNEETDYTDLIVYEQLNYNFNPNDGINTTVILNVQSDVSDDANYALVLDDDNTILSRWFIIDAARTRLNQYQITLRRDLLADYYDDIVNAPVFIEKATVKYGNPLLFNSEDMTFNQIKTREEVLMDETTSAWIVGYIDRKTEAKNIDITSAVRQVPTYTNWEDVPFYEYLNKEVKGNLSDVYFSVYYQALPYGANYVDRVQFRENGANTWKEYKASSFDEDYSGIYFTSDTSSSYNVREIRGRGFAQDLANYWQSNISTFSSTIASQLGALSASKTAEFLNTYTTEGSLIKVGDTYYNIKRSDGTVLANTTTNIAKNSALGALMIDACREVGLSVSEPLLHDKNIRITSSSMSYQLTYTPASAPVQSEYTLNIPAALNRTHLKDAPYDMFCIPYPITSPRFVAIENNSNYSIDPKISMLTAQALAIELGSQLYDLQLLPYCPIKEIKPEAPGSGRIYLNLLEDNKDYTWVYLGESSHNNTSIVLWASQSEFSTAINTIYDLPESGVAVNSSIAIKVKEPKIEAMCDSYRLVSPNFNSQFEFNAVKNEGVDYFVVDCTYKPYSPYIRVAPNFKGLYGGEFNDARGLILGGDFSLPTISDAWTQYELNNKNYLNAFNRQIENMEVNNKYQRLSEIMTALTGTATAAVSGASTGATTGAILGGGQGALIGAAAGLVGAPISAAGGIADIAINDKLRSEALDYTKDQFGYNLGNIRALPYTLNRVSAFNINNKIFPILEYYTCTETEKEALRQKIKYNGMTIMTIGTINEYLQDEQTYIKGKIIRLDELDNHTTIEIANELNKGFYI